MDTVNIEGIILTPLKKIIHPQGDVYHGIKKSDNGFADFGEAYFSTIKHGEIKPWKKHLRMTLNLIVPVGEIRFVMYDDCNGTTTKSDFQDINISLSNYYRLTIPPNVWMAFQGIGKSTNLLLNIANLEHDPQEVERLELNSIDYDW